MTTYDRVRVDLHHPLTLTPAGAVSFVRTMAKRGLLLVEGPDRDHEVDQETRLGFTDWLQADTDVDGTAVYPRQACHVDMYLPPDLCDPVVVGLYRLAEHQHSIHPIDNAYVQRRRRVPGGYPIRPDDWETVHMASMPSRRLVRNARTGLLGSGAGRGTTDMSRTRD